MSTAKTLLRAAVFIGILAVLIVVCDAAPAFAGEMEYDADYNVTFDPVTELITEDGTIYDDETGLAEMIMEEQDSTSSVFKIVTSLKYPYIQLGSTVTFKATKSCKWSSSDPGIVKIFSNGKVYAAAKGTATITAKATDGSGDIASYTVTVTSFGETGSKLIGHRGYCKYAPENTKASFKLAVNAGFYGVECDVYKTADDVFVVSHDDNLKRIYGVDAKITESNYSDIKDLVAMSGNGTSVYQEERLTTLDDYMKIIAAGKKKAVIEIKEDLTQEYADMLYQKVSSYGINDRVRFLASKKILIKIDRSASAFSDVYTVKPELMMSCSADPSVAASSFDNMSALQYASERGYCGVCTRYYYMDADNVALAHDLGLIVAVYTVNDYNMAYYLASTGEIDEIITEYDLTSNIFKDVKPSHNYARSVYWASKKRIAEGYTDGSGLFGVSDKVTRGQAVMFLWRIAGKPEPKGSKQVFSDVPLKHSFYKAVQWAYENKIAAGYNDKTFGVNSPCTRGHAVMFLWRYNNRPSPVGKNVVFTDVTRDHGYYKAVKWAVENGITDGYSDGTFGVDNNCTRGHMVTFLWRMG